MLKLLPWAIIATWFLTACVSSYGQESTGEYIDSAGITLKVKTELVHEAAIEGIDISVTTYKGIVQLSGFVDSEEERQTAIAVAQQVSGVKAVRNGLMIKRVYTSLH
jgi:hyperosmotically inducible protein